MATTYDDKKHEVAHIDHADHHDLEKYESNDLPVLEISAAADRSIKRRADTFVLPLMMLMYGLQYLDKMSMSYASIMGFRKDRNISIDQYSWLSSIFREHRD